MFQAESWKSDRLCHLLLLWQLFLVVICMSGRPAWVEALPKVGLWEPDVSGSGSCSLPLGAYSSSLHCLPVCFPAQFIVLGIIDASVDGLGAIYFKDCLLLHEPSCPLLLSSCSKSWCFQRCSCLDCRTKPSWSQHRVYIHFTEKPHWPPLLWFFGELIFAGCLVGGVSNGSAFRFLYIYGLFSCFYYFAYFYFLFVF